MPKVTVGIPAYNEEEWIDRTIESVLDQTFEDFEILVVDDGSDDDTATVVGEYTDDPRVTYIYQDNQGVAAAQNASIELGSGEYYAILEADDLWVPEKLERQMEYLENHDVGLLHSNAYYIDDNEEVIMTHDSFFSPERCQYSAGQEAQRQMFLKNPIAYSSVILDYKILKSLQFDETFDQHQDHEMWLRVAGKYDIAYLEEILVKKRFHHSNISDDYREIFDTRIQFINKAVAEFPHLQYVRDYKLSTIYLTYAISLLLDGRTHDGRAALRTSIELDPSNWRSYALFLLSFAGKRIVSSVTKAGRQQAKQHESS